MKNILLIMVTLLFGVYSYGHVDLTTDHRLNTATNNYKDSLPEYLFIKVDTITGDTTKYHRASQRYLRISAAGVSLQDGTKVGGMGTVCGCEPTPHGYWIERYRTGNIKSQGRYHCLKRVGTWIDYHENGEIQKIENHTKAYEDVFTPPQMPWSPLRNRILLQGPYIEYYANGRLKVKGDYEIWEEFSTIDTSYTLDYETYELIPKVETGEFWLPRSKKVGIWTTYDSTGQIISIENHSKPNYDNDNFRSIQARYWELIKESAKLIEVGKK